MAAVIIVIEAQSVSTASMYIQKSESSYQSEVVSLSFSRSVARVLYDVFLSTLKKL